MDFQKIGSANRRHLPHTAAIATLSLALGISAPVFPAQTWAGSEGAPPSGGKAAPDAKPDPYATALELYRAKRFAEAGTILEEAIRSGAKRGYQALLGWCQVHQRRFAEARTAFEAALKEEPGNREARQGFATSLAGLGEAQKALDLALELLRDSPDDADAEAIANRALAPPAKVADRRLGSRPRLSPVAVPSRAGSDYLEALWKGKYVPLFVKGVNLGVALPGKFPAEFPEDRQLYRSWLAQIADLGANAVRLYTLLPPAFYDALKEHNDAVVRAAGVTSSPPHGYLWLIHGVWTELPENDDYESPAFKAQFIEEMERIVDVLHGDIAVGFRPGHACGLYRSDVSAMTLGIILGREWEPFSVEAYDAARPAASFEGRFFTMKRGTAMEAWVAAMMEHSVAYEHDRYGAMRPVTFTNWPTLDPLAHPTEATKAEESAIAAKLGLHLESRAVREYDNDGVGIDTNRIAPTPAASAGLFASYHAYPYYPDFLNVDPGYLAARDARGPNNYRGYLEQLRAHHRGMPVLISEIGVPTSRGVAHVQPQGFNHGGHNEQEKGEIDSRLIETIHGTGCAGGVIFAWLDEWFKRNWLVMDFELPAERNIMWLNALDPEQNYGLMAAAPGRSGPRIVLDGEGGDWEGAPILASAEDATPGAGARLRALRAAHDEAYLYLRVDVDGLQPSTGGATWDRMKLLVGIDSYGEKEGDIRFPGVPGATAPTGMEFIVEISGEKTSRLQVDTPYDLFTHRYNRPYRSVPNDDGRYVEILVETNRRRIGRDGTIYPEVMHNRSPLRFGTTDTEAPEYDSLADWSANASNGIIEMRLAWGLLNVTDPSSRRVVADPPDFAEEAGTRITDGFRFYAIIVDPSDGRLLGTLPGTDDAGRIPFEPGALFAWPTWDEPGFHTRLKRSYYILRNRWSSLEPVAAR